MELLPAEGCSSCPPAENWLGALRHESGLWRDFVPVAWHVNYWDRLGWPDKFAERSYTDRQYAYARSWQSGRVYTPGFVRGGKEWQPSLGGSDGEPAWDRGGVDGDDSRRSSAGHIFKSDRGEGTGGACGFARRRYHQ
ncbi:MAG: DUF1223 domain-containing protein [Candidatus Synoicihabitans palmerolidicus]|nr:DUF1223 domain-containing protein [Candidatus Synoicihabitans palmerolidicus]